MRRVFASRWAICGIVMAGIFTDVALAAQDELYAPPAPAELRELIDVWLTKRGLAQSPVVDAVAPLWEFETSPTADEMFDVVMKTFYYADEDVRDLVEACRGLDNHLEALNAPVIATSADDPLFTNNVLYFYARHLAVLTLYEEALDVYANIDVSHVVDPAGCLFYRAVCEHNLLQREEGLATLAVLLHNTESVPVRFRVVSELMQHDLESISEKSLGEVARQMKDVERRLTLGRAGQRVQRVEQRIITTLDEIIEKLEQQQGGGGGGGGQQASRPTDPASESYVGGVKGPGQTDKKDIGHKDDWGDLPPKAEAAAKNMLDRQFPAHYRQAVEEYLKKLAERPVSGR